MKLSEVKSEEGNLSSWSLLFGFIGLLIALIVVPNIIMNNLYSNRENIHTEIFVDKAAPAPTVGLVVDPKLKVVEVVAGSGAAQVGFQNGDELKEIDGNLLTSPSEVKQAALKGQAINITVVRNSQKLILTVKPSSLSGRGSGPTPTAVPQNYVYL